VFAGTDKSTNSMKLVLVVAVALIDEQHRVLLAQRPAGKPMAGLWEFPGGKASLNIAQHPKHEDAHHTYMH